MAEHRKDLQTRNILTKPALGLSGVYVLGDPIFALLGNLVRERKVRGAYFTHYCCPPQVEPHVKVGIRYERLEDLDGVALMSDGLCDERKDVVIDKGGFEPTTGTYEKLPDEKVVDYIICHSFEFLLKHRKELETRTHRTDEMARTLLLHQQEITGLTKSTDIFRDSSQARPITQEEEFWIRERFIHHLLNACKFTSDSEAQIWRILLGESKVR